MKGGLGNLMKQAQKMQENLQKAQEELGSMEVTGQAGGGLVSVASGSEAGSRASSPFTRALD